MKSNYLKKLKDEITERKKIYSVVFMGMFVFVALCVSSCDEEEYCHKKGKLNCSSADACCDQDVPYHDGHGSCWGSLSGCRETGWACTVCY